MGTSLRPTVICLTPVRNEAWILRRFLRCASTWADHIVIADQHSEDGSRDIARACPKVTLIDNNASAYDEAQRQRLLIEAARRIPADGRRILIALDADEMLTANWQDSPEWDQIMDASPGTVLWFRWVNVAPGVQRGWVSDHDIPFGLVDDGRAHAGHKIHSPRLPITADAPALVMQDVKVLHYQYANWERMKSKQRWYQCWERVNNPEKRPVTLYRQYHHMDAARACADPLEKKWMDGYERQGIDMTQVPMQDYYYWDEEIVRLIEEHGARTFSKLNIWDVDWTALSQRVGRDVNGALKDPRTGFEKSVHRWLGRTQEQASDLHVRGMQKLLQLFGW